MSANRERTPGPRLQVTAAATTPLPVSFVCPSQGRVRGWGVGTASKTKEPRVRLESRRSSNSPSPGTAPSQASLLCGYAEWLQRATGARRTRCCQAPSPARQEVQLLALQNEPDRGWRWFAPTFCRSAHCLNALFRWRPRFSHGRIRASLRLRSTSQSTRGHAGVFPLALFHPRKPHVAEGQGQHGNGQPNTEVFAKADISLSSRAARFASGMPVGTSARTSRRPVRRQKNQSTNHARNSPTSATGPRCQRKSRYPMPEKDPTRMFCGFPVIVATLPTFEAVATAKR